MSGKDIGYVRVSTHDQSTARQLDGVRLDKTFEEHASGKDAARPALQACLEYVCDGDVLHVHSIDRLARNLQDLLAIVTALKSKGATVKFHKEKLEFVGNAEGGERLEPFRGYKRFSLFFPQNRLAWASNAPAVITGNVRNIRQKAVYTLFAGRFCNPL